MPPESDGADQANTTNSCSQKADERTGIVKIGARFRHLDIVHPADRGHALAGRFHIGVEICLSSRYNS